MKVATAPTKERLLILINQFYFTENCTITPDNFVVNTVLQKQLGYVKQKGKRFEYYTN